MNVFHACKCAAAGIINSDNELKLFIAATRTTPTNIKIGHTTYPAIAMIGTTNNVETREIGHTLDTTARDMAALFRKLKKIEDRGGDREKKVLKPIIEKEIEDRCGIDWRDVYDVWSKL